jgi:hypothetical protein
MRFQGLMAVDNLQYDLLQRFPKYGAGPLEGPSDILEGRSVFSKKKLF